VGQPRSSVTGLRRRWGVRVVRPFSVERRIGIRYRARISASSGFDPGGITLRVRLRELIELDRTSVQGSDSVLQADVTSVLHRNG
jgi:hypothetical protein